MLDPSYTSLQHCCRKKLCGLVLLVGSTIVMGLNWIFVCFAVDSRGGFAWNCCCHKEGG